jgi:hypothetical protein
MCAVCGRANPGSAICERTSRAGSDETVAGLPDNTTLQLGAEPSPGKHEFAPRGGRVSRQHAFPTDAGTAAWLHYDERQRLWTQ